jgi:para-aminobenzoate synthetase component I
MLSLASSSFSKMNQFGREGRPFLFLLDYELKKPVVLALDEAWSAEVKFAVGDITNTPESAQNQRFTQAVEFTKKPIAFQDYRVGFDQVLHEIRLGNSFLLNYTVRTPITCSLSLEQVYERTQARYKIWLRDQFVCFSPEIFVKISASGVISSNPMKGTIDATLPDAEARLLKDEKERAEHHTIVDLIRNDLSMVAKQVEVTRFQYLERLQTNQRDLFQMSSQVEGQLPKNWKKQIGTILKKLLPAGSISGAPKRRTTQIIRAAEGGPRGYYTGICGVFDGEKLDSGVMIRFIESDGDALYFRSGGGITCMSEAEPEYEECVAKVYLPLKP